MSSTYPNKTRPAGHVAIHATDETMNAPGETYHGTPTKVRPSDAIIAAGWLPAEMPPAERLNWRQNDQDRRVAVLDMMNARTFVEPSGTAGVGGTSAGTGSAVGWFAGARWPAVETIFHATNTTAVEKSIDGGYTWTTTYNVPSAAFSGIATRETALSAGGTAASYTLTGVANIALTGGDTATNNAWASQTLTGTGTSNEASTVVADPFVDNVFLVGGNDFIASVTIPCVWRVVAPLGAYASQTKILMGTPTGFPVRIVCAGPTFKLGASWTGATNGLWRWEDGDTIATAITSPTTSEIKSIMWCPEDGVFLLIADAGPGVELWTSADGATGTWTQLAPDVAAFFAGASTYLNGACVRGSIIMIPLLASAVGYVAISGDLGATWEIIGDPISRHSASKHVQRCADLGPRFIAGGYNAASEVLISMSLRVG